MSWPVLPHGFLGSSSGDNDTYRIERSLRFNSADSAFLNRTFSSGNRRLWTWSGWIKRTTLGTVQRFFTCRTASNDNDSGEIAFQDDAFQLIGWGTVWRKSSALFRDTSSWYHFVMVLDTTQATANNRVRMYVNGTELTSFSTSNNPSQNSDLGINQAATHRLGVADYGDYANFYLAECHFIDGQALTPSSFGETDAITGRWKAKAYSGTYGTNGFYLKFADNSGTTATTLGKDSSGNGNNWTPNNFSVTAGAGNDSLVDSPTNYGTDTGVGGGVRGNYATWNTLDRGSEVVLANGNLDVTWSGVNGHSVRSTSHISSGKWYWEVICGANASIGIIQSNIVPALNGWVGQSTYGSGGSYSYAPDGRKVTNSSYSSFGTAMTNGNVVGVAYDADNGRIFFSLNGTWQASGDPSTGTNPAYSSITGTYSPAIGYWTSPTSNTNSANFGQRPFAYTAPSGFKALCTTNLPQPTIQKPSSYMDVVTYTGDGTSSRAITGLNFQPELIWIKNRTNAYNHTVVDSVRGGSLYLETNNTNADQSATVVSSFNSNGFQIGTSSIQVNGTSNTYVAWAWDEAPIAGMDIVSFTGTGSNMTISHSLGVAPRMIINKSRSGTGGWPVYHASLGNTGAVQLESTGAFNVSSTYWNNTSPTASNFTVASGLAVNGATYINYLFAEVEGFSKFGSYTGNGSADGPFVWCGFRPRYVMIKRTDVIETWITKDTARSSYNGYDVELYPNFANSEGGPYTPPIMDYISNGFKLRNNTSGSNASGGTYIFAAFAESPFKYARAR